MKETDLAGEPITAKLTNAPGNGAAIGGLKVVTANGWFAARPSGTENVYKIYAESFKGETHLAAIVKEAQAIVARAGGMREEEEPVLSLPLEALLLRRTSSMRCSPART